MTAAPIRGLSDPRVDLRGDFRGTADLTAADPTPEGRRHFSLTAGVIDMDAEALFGRGMCHWLAGAMHSLTGWNVGVIDYDAGATGWQQAHSGVITPRGTLLDIFGERSPDEVCRYYTESGTYRTRLREVPAQLIPGAMLPRDDFRRDPLWWCDQFASPESQSVLLHFARLLVRNHGYADHIDPAAIERPMPPPDADAAPTSAPDSPTATTPAIGGGGTPVSNIEEARAILTAGDSKAAKDCRDCSPKPRRRSARSRPASGRQPKAAPTPRSSKRHNSTHRSRTTSPNHWAW